MPQLFTARRTAASTWTMSLLLLGSAARCVTEALAAQTAPASRPLVAGVGAGCLIAAASLYLAGHRCPLQLLRSLPVVTIGVTTTLVATSTTRADVVMNAFAYPWTALYAAHFLPRRAAYGYAAAGSAAFGVGIVTSGQAPLIGAWVVVTVTLAAITAVTAALVATLQQRSETDPLTGVANRAGFERLAARELAAAARHGRALSMVVCDIDGLKAVNDAAGHAAGDALLTRVTAAWTGVLRASDVLARIGGDEFAVLLPDTDATQAGAVVGRLSAAAANAFSAGAATWTGQESLDTLLARADAAMYAHKSRGAAARSIPTPRRPQRPRRTAAGVRD